MLLRNDLLEYAGEGGHTLRILWIDSAHTQAYTYALGRVGACPRQASLAALVADVQEGRARLLPHDRWRLAIDPATLPPKYLALRASAWALVSELVRDEPALFDARSRGRLIAACSAAHGVSHPTLYRYLRRYWERGQHPDALLPDYANSGAAGKTRRANAGVKRGRPSKSGAPGLNADAAVRATIRAAAMRYAATHAAFSRRDAYRQMIADYFGASQEAAPTYGQFSYWIDRDGVLPTPH
jgi:putative transposase